MCPGCGRDIYSASAMYAVHSFTENGRERCPCSEMPTIAVDKKKRINNVALLAYHIRDSDPIQLINYLTATPADELQKLLMIALAAIPMDRSMGDLLAWADGLEGLFEN